MLDLFVPIRLALSDLGQGLGLPGVKLGPAEISELPVVGDLRDRRRARRRLGRLRQDPAGCRSLQEARSWPHSHFPPCRDRSPYLDRLGRTGIPALARRSASGRPMGTRRHDPAPSTWYSSTRVFKSRLSSLTSQRTEAGCPRRSSGSRRSVGGNVSTTTFIFGSTVASSAGGNLAVDCQGLDSKPVFAIVR